MFSKIVTPDYYRVERQSLVYTKDGEHRELRAADRAQARVFLDWLAAHGERIVETRDRAVAERQYDKLMKLGPPEGIALQIVRFTYL